MSKVEREVDELRLARVGGVLTCGADPQDLRVTLAVPGLAPTTVRVPRSRSGLGGMGLAVSADERYAALHVFTGQSQEGCEVFALEPTLRRIGTLPLARGEGAGPVFSPDGSWLTTLVSTDPRVRGTGKWFEEVQDEDADDDVIVDWGVLRALRTADGATYEAAVGAEIPRCTDLDEVNEWKAYRLVRLAPRRNEVHSLLDFSARGELTIGAPWGEAAERIACRLPPPTALTARGFTRSTA